MWFGSLWNSAANNGGFIGKNGVFTSSIAECGPCFEERDRREDVLLGLEVLFAGIVIACALLAMALRAMLTEI